MAHTYITQDATYLIIFHSVLNTSIISAIDFLLSFFFSLRQNHQAGKIIPDVFRKMIISLPAKSTVATLKLLNVISSTFGQLKKENT